MKYYWALKRNGLLNHEKIWRKLECIFQSKKCLSDRVTHSMTPMIRYPGKDKHCCYWVANLFPLFGTPWTVAHQASLSFTISQNLLKLMYIELVMTSSVIPFSFCRHSFPATVSSLMSQLFPSGGQNIGASASASVLPMNEYPALISFQIDWFDLPAVPGTLKQSKLCHCFHFWPIYLP